MKKMGTAERGKTEARLQGGKMSEGCKSCSKCEMPASVYLTFLNNIIYHFQNNFFLV